MSISAQKHHNYPSCTCTDPLPNSIGEAVDQTFQGEHEMTRDELIEKLIATEPRINPDKDAAYKRAVIEMTYDAILSACQLELGEPVQGFDSRVRIVCFNEWLETHKSNVALSFSYDDMKKAYCDAGTNGFTAGQAQAGKVVVKDLVWVQNDQVTWITENSHPSYAIFKSGGLYYIGIDSEPSPLGGHLSEEVAMRVANTHHKALILAEIEVV